MTRPAPLLLALACSPLEPSGTPLTPTPTVLQGVQMALECGRRHHLAVRHPPEHLRYFLTSGFPDINGSMRADDVRGRDIWVDQRVAGEVLVWAHGALHALHDLPGGPTTAHPSIFAECDLWPI